jgi:hypothetical protein
MTFCILGGLACLAFGALAIYGGQVLPGVKLVLAGLLLPVFGIWWAYHWLLVVILCLIGMAAWLLIAHYALIRPALSTIAAWAHSVEARLPSPQIIMHTSPVTVSEPKPALVSKPEPALVSKPEPALVSKPAPRVMAPDAAHLPPKV